jgi:phenylacetate-CoA ligase
MQVAKSAVLRTVHEVRFGDVSFDIADSEIDRRPLSERAVALLAAFVEDTYETCSFHRQRLQKRGITPNELRSLEDFQRIPLLTSADVAAIPDFLLLPDLYRTMFRDGFGTLPAELRIAKKFMTSGTTGRPKVSYYTPMDWEANLVSLGRQMEGVPLAKYTRVFNLYHPGHSAAKYTEDAYSRLGCVVENRHPSHKTDDAVANQFYAGLPDHGGFNCIVGPPGRTTDGPDKGATVDTLLNADIDNHIGRQVRYIAVAGSPLDSRLRIRERLWEANDLAGAEHATLVQRYGSTESGIVGSECQQQDGIHLFFGFVYAEVVDPESGRPVKNGERGVVVVSTLRHGSRYLRYALGDEATYIAEPCSCGRVTPRIKDIRRVVDLERLRTGCAAGGA